MVRPVPIILSVAFSLAMVQPSPAFAQEQERNTAVRCVQLGGRTIITSLALCRQAGGILLGGPPPPAGQTEPARTIIVDRPSWPPASPLLPAVQALLAALGYDIDPIDGAATGQRTSDAIRQFQRSEGLTLTGEPDADLLRRIIAAIRHRARADPQPQAGEQGAADAQATITNLEHQLRRARQELRDLMELMNRVLDAFDLSR